jgi:ABC-type Fe3+-hydroxamate transport system substrate-binding protein
MFLTNSSQLHYIPKRIISLVPSQTELLHTLELDAETVGITKFCIHPKEWYRHKIKVGGTKSIHIDKVIELDPDLIIANKEENVREQVERLAEKYPVWVTEVNNLPEALQMTEDIGNLTGTQNKALALSSRIQMAFNQLPTPTKKFKTAYLIWKNPYMAAGGETFINDMLDKAGFTNIFENFSRYPEVNPAQIKSAGCEVLLLSSEPFPFSDKHIRELEQELPGIQIKLVDGEMFSWYGSHLLQSPAYFNKLYSNCRF